MIKVLWDILVINFLKCQFANNFEENFDLVGWLLGIFNINKNS